MGKKKNQTRNRLSFWRISREDKVRRSPFECLKDFLKEISDFFPFPNYLSFPNPLIFFRLKRTWKFNVLFEVQCH